MIFCNLSIAITIRAGFIIFPPCRIFFKPVESPHTGDLHIVKPPFILCYFRENPLATRVFLFPKTQFALFDTLFVFPTCSKVPFLDLELYFRLATEKLKFICANSFICRLTSSMPVDYSLSLSFCGIILPLFAGNYLVTFRRVMLN